MRFLWVCIADGPYVPASISHSYKLEIGRPIDISYLDFFRLACKIVYCNDGVVGFQPSLRHCNAEGPPILSLTAGTLINLAACIIEIQMPLARGCSCIYCTYLP